MEPIISVENCYDYTKYGYNFPFFFFNKCVNAFIYPFLSIANEGIMRHLSSLLFGHSQLIYILFEFIKLRTRVCSMHTKQTDQLNSTTVLASTNGQSNDEILN